MLFLLRRILATPCSAHSGHQMPTRTSSGCFSWSVTNHDKGKCTDSYCLVEREENFQNVEPIVRGGEVSALKRVGILVMKIWVTCGFFRRSLY